MLYCGPTMYNIEKEALYGVDQAAEAAHYDAQADYEAEAYGDGMDYAELHDHLHLPRPKAKAQQGPLVCFPLDPNEPPF